MRPTGCDATRSRLLIRNAKMYNPNAIKGTSNNPLKPLANRDADDSANGRLALIPFQDNMQTIPCVTYRDIQVDRKTRKSRTNRTSAD